VQRQAVHARQVAVVVADHLQTAAAACAARCGRE
jgi:hypothetical protein